MALFAGAVLAACDGGSDAPDASVADGDAGITDFTDTDGDTIPDAWEGREDADGDGTPNYLDDDSDGDGLPDRLEAGDDDVRTPPRNSDGAGPPDFLDTDSDDNGILDADEAPVDTDGDGDLDFADLDDDNDLARDVDELADGGPSADTDGDGLVDFKDPDRDDDSIRDGEDGSVDTDRDSIPDWRDADSDSDGFSDREEAGDDDLSTPPVDTDGDGDPDFRDPDSDGDGVSDVDERAAGTDRTSPDTDMDGVGDLVEIAAGTDPLDGSVSPRTRGDFVFVVPFEEAPDPARDTLEFGTALQTLDVYFAFDTTGSMGEEMRAMRSRTRGVPAIVEGLRCSAGEDPAVSGCIPDLWTGVGTFSEIDTFENRLSLQADPARTAASIPGDTFGGRWEAPYQPPTCIADGARCDTPGGEGCATGAGLVGCPGFRADAVRVYMQITDADQQCIDTVFTVGRCDMFTAATAGADLRAYDIHFLSLVGTDDDQGVGTPRSVAEAIGVAAGSVDAAGDPFVYSARDAAVVTEAVNAVRALAASEFPMTIEAREVAGDDGDALRFIDFLETHTRGVGACATGVATADEGWGAPGSDADGVDDAFPGVVPGTRICWDVVPRVNDLQEPADVPLLFEARLTVRARGSRVDERAVFFLVPPKIEVPSPLI